MKVRAVVESDWDSIIKIQAEAYHDGVVESIDVLKSKSLVSPKTCFVCESKDGEIAGYLLSHPWDSPTPPKLFQPLTKVSGQHQHFIHDMAVSSKAQGQGVGRLLTNKVFEFTQRQGVKRINLVAVQGSSSYWSSLGFAPLDSNDVSSTYGDDAALMEMQLSN
ncbi:GNAT family N-acetyltransferase [Vibrio taketomensis]|uniref:GNAT family N-acetyltransferase n=1 Tax=Vibrio taketomensis TaxID=2572923 RepID=UPI001E298938|nr:GNAT family N-acetyltransferase [Vibrio taketomensis]